MSQSDPANRRLKRIKKLLPLKLRENLYRAFIAPHFNYCAESWHFCSNRSTENSKKWI